MAIKAVFLAGAVSTTASGLFQWDYGQVLEIECADIGTEIMEVHFSCDNMTEAVVRPCSFSNGVGTVTIPDQCLEQSSTITAWIYRIIGTQGHTEKTITLPVTARKRPSVARDIPPSVVDKYTELITEINEAVENLESGNVTVAKAENANNANYANAAGNASSANYATSAKRADSATNATTADIARGAYYRGGYGFLVEANASASYYLTPGVYSLDFLAKGGVQSFAYGLIALGAMTNSNDTDDLAFTAKMGVNDEYIIYTGRVADSCRIMVTNTTSSAITVIPRMILEFH